MDAVPTPPPCCTHEGPDAFWRAASCMCECHSAPALTPALIRRAFAALVGAPHLEVVSTANDPEGLRLLPDPRRETP